MNPQNVDIYANMNSKFVYVEKHLKRQINSLFKDILAQRSKMEQRILRAA